MSESEAPPENKIPAAKPPTANELSLAAVKAFRDRLHVLTPRVWVTPMLVGINVAIFVAMVATGVNIMSPTSTQLLRWGANAAELTTGGQWWRLVSNVFVHIGIIHIAMNMLVLWSIGRFIEQLVGSRGFLVAYLFAGICGSLASIVWNPIVISAGASGAVFGAYGMLIGFLARNRTSIPADQLKAVQRTAVTFLVYNLAFGLSVKGIDMAAHVGGLLAGGLFGLILSQPLDEGTRARRPKLDAMVLGAGLVLSVLVALVIPHGPDKNQKAFEDLEQQALTALSDAARNAQKDHTSDEAFAKILDEQVLPSYRDAIAHIDQVKRFPADHRKRLHAFMDERLKVWELFSDALHHPGDEARLARWKDAEKKIKEAKAKDDE